MIRILRANGDLLTRVSSRRIAMILVSALHAEGVRAVMAQETPAPSGGC